ncbi:hypothetical protein [Hyphomonas johnsonii]|uniref:Uncharacterized protein n=1 Tax=Hyphomonas johnsonii MHS-2 TaxID=1280950 RepID=A0A059FPU0_9PROT|nr:hypothetical protein [Hyphomonas johnsonii]KCZ92700.1 hypothetical protein HJO_07092 [Hyphomonas johnsonii MHS-2]
MPLQNRVDPFGEIHAVPDKGAFMGNRGGCFHLPDQTLRSRRWATQQWIICLLDFKGRRRALMQPGLYTELFFLDEATALAAGHRPCHECRRADALAFRAALDRANVLPASAKVVAMDRLIAGEVQSVLKGEATREITTPAALPDGAFYTVSDTAWLKQGETARPWSFAGYGAAQPLHASGHRLTPRATCAALAAGYLPALHPSAAR